MACKVRLLLCCAVTVSVLAGCGTAPGAEDLPEVVDFNFHIRPILSNSCFVCHGPDVSTREADLRLDDRSYATARRKGGARAIVPGNPRRSLLIQRISAKVVDQRMPPATTNKVLTPREVALLRRWVRQGAPYKEHWAFIAPTMPEVPEGAGAIDYFVEDRLARAGLSPAPEAAPEALLRRASYVLTGLPPEPELVQTFLEDPGPATYERIVDTLLASPHFGERWARHWMDLVRYAESKGHEFDFTVQGAWRYRDYLIRAFNADVPYDRFLKEHLAGDLLPSRRTHAELGYDESPVATAYFTFGEGKHSPVDTRIDEAERIDNIIDVTTKTFQGLTVACARCHDHKFDPIPTTDYYSLYGIVESARFTPRPLLTARYRVRADSVAEEFLSLRQQLGDQWRRVATRTPVVVASATTTPRPSVAWHWADSTGEALMLGDFRMGSYDGWYAEGPAFEGGPHAFAPVYDGERVDRIAAGVVSSRARLPGVPGALRSPGFTIDHDSIMVMAAGRKAVIRIVLNSFQLIRAPIHGGLDREISTSELTTYVFDVAMWKGTKAYVELLAGTYDKQQYVTEQHAFRLADSSYFEVAAVVAYDGQRPTLAISPTGEAAPLADAVTRWQRGSAGPVEVRAINDALRQGRLPRLARGAAALNQIRLGEPPFYIGMTDGDTVRSGVFFRGNAKMEEETPVPHRFFTTLDPHLLPFTESASGRLDLARAMASADNPLTARVMVNRLWHHTFGRGIVATVDNFGAQGALPTHPELLDYLALRFVEQGWSVKRLLKEMVLSRTFRRVTRMPDGVADVDPQNLLLSHYPIRRLEAEAIRDGILAVSQRLNRTMYGEPVPVHLTEFMKGRGRPQASGPLDGEARRSVYIAVRRNFLAPMMLAFDKPIPFSTFGNRNSSNVPAQSLTLLNDPFVAGEAEAWGQALVEMPHPTIEARIEHIFLRAMSRAPTHEEVEHGRNYLKSSARESGIPAGEILRAPSLWAAYCHAVFNLKEFIYLI